MAQLLGHVASLVVARYNWMNLLRSEEAVQVLTRHNRGKALLRVNAHIDWMIDDDELQPIEIRDLIHRFGELENILAVPGFELPALDLDGFLRPRPSMAAVR